MSKESEASDVATPESCSPVDKRADSSGDSKNTEYDDAPAKMKVEAVKFSKGSSKAGKTPAPPSKFQALGTIEEAVSEGATTNNVDMS